MYIFRYNKEICGYVVVGGGVENLMGNFDWKDPSNQNFPSNFPHHHQQLHIHIFLYYTGKYTYLKLPILEVIAKPHIAYYVGNK